MKPINKTRMIFALLILCSSLSLADPTPDCSEELCTEVDAEFMGDSTCAGTCYSSCESGECCIQSSINNAQWELQPYSKCVCHDENGACSSDNDCCTGLSCDGGFCKTELPTEICGLLGQVCCNGGSCGPGLSCCSDNVCAASCSAPCTNCNDGPGYYCESGDQVFSYQISRSCVAGTCVSTNVAGSEAFVEDCDSSDGYGNPYCSGSDKMRDYNDFYCQSGSCQFNANPNLIQACGNGNTPGNWGSNYCSGNIVQRQRNITANGCSADECFSNFVSTETQDVMTCNRAFCINSNNIPCPQTAHNLSQTETCLYSDACQGGACNFRSSGILRQGYCDTCSASGVNQGSSCQEPGAWIGNTCYYGAAACTGNSCTINQALTACTATNASCCQAGTDIIHQGVGCNPATGPTLAGSFDRDANIGTCTSNGETCSVYNWSRGGESFAFGEYDTGTSLECCGDDAGEFFIYTAATSRSACCNLASECVDGTGTCRSGEENTPGLCTDSVDNDCDGQVDASDPSCYKNLTGYVLYKKEPTWTISDAEVLFDIPGFAKRSATSNFLGRYTLSDVFVGVHLIRARRSGFIDSVVLINFTVPANPVVYDFLLDEGVNCNIDCTDSFGYCNAACNGYTINTSGLNDTCNISPECINRPKGYLQTNITNGQGQR